jgi:putative ATP-dependent endonuclease of OLD family
MYLSRIKIENFRNFSEFDVQLTGNVVVVGENRVGKSNLLYALRLIFDPTLPDSARQLGLSGFWDGLDGPSPDDKIVVSVEITKFDDIFDVLDGGARENARRMLGSARMGRYHRRALGA